MDEGDVGEDIVVTVQYVGSETVRAIMWRCVGAGEK
jgi:hypothetical protein